MKHLQGYVFFISAYFVRRCLRSTFIQVYCKTVFIDVLYLTVLLLRVAWPILATFKRVNFFY